MYNNSSKYELKLSAAGRMHYTYYVDMLQKPLACYVRHKVING
jgi:hypothetical protein